MLNFWRKSAGSNRPSNAQISPPLPQSPPKGDTKGPLSQYQDDVLFDIDEFEAKREKTRLAKTLHEVLNDKSALAYFMHYMESRNAQAFVMCHLDIEAFKTDLSTHSPLPLSKLEHDSLSVSTDCDSLTADSSSLNLNLDDSAADVTNCDTSDSVSCGRGSVDTALAIFKKYIALEAQCNIRCSEELRNEVMENICHSEKVCSATCFQSVQNYLLSTMDSEYFEAFLGTDFYCKHQIDVLTSGCVVLEDILHNETALFYFMEYLEQENQRTLLEFWIAASNFQQQLTAQRQFFDPIEAQNDAVVLYDKYFSLQAHCPLGCSDRVRFAVEQNICGEHGLRMDCFQLPLKLVEKVLDDHYLKPFLASQLFYKYLSELINTVQSAQNGYSNCCDSRYSPSDCSSEKSFSTNTFLALEMQPNQVRKKCADMSIDTRELYDPDALWRRKQKHRLSLGRVNHLGKYETDFEPEPDRGEFKLRNVVKKFVSLEEETKKREEMAYQVAEMIIKDITSVTLSDRT